MAASGCLKPIHARLNLRKDLERTCMSYHLTQLAAGSYDVWRGGEIIAGLVRSGHVSNPTWTAELLVDMPPEEMPPPVTAPEHTFASLEEASLWLGARIPGKAARNPRPQVASENTLPSEEAVRESGHGWGIERHMGIPPELIKVGQCYLTGTGVVRRVVQVLPDGNVEYQERAGNKRWCGGRWRAMDRTLFTMAAVRLVPRDWTPDSDEESHTLTEKNDALSMPPASIAGERSRAGPMRSVTRWPLFSGQSVHTPAADFTQSLAVR